MILKKHVLGAMAIVAAAMASVTATAQADPTAGSVLPALTVGKKAPSLQVSKWAKGKEIKKFEKGQVYVVEFWATWCGPCKTSIPHLTELAKKHAGKAEVIGVSVFEAEETTQDDVVKWVAEMGDQMNYNVALDDGMSMAQNWMVAANQNGIPTAFIVNQDGVIAWIGHPMEMDAPLQQVVDKKWDLKKAMEASNNQAKLMELEMELQTAMMEEDSKKVVAAVDKMLATSPPNKDALNGLKAEYMMDFDEAGAQKLMRELLKSSIKDNPIGLNQLAWAIVDPEKDRKSPDFKLAVSLAQMAVKLTKEQDANILDTHALALFKAGNKKGAIEQQETAIKLAYADPEFDPQSIAEFKARLEMFKKG